MENIYVTGIQPKEVPTIQVIIKDSPPLRNVRLEQFLKKQKRKK